MGFFVSAHTEKGNFKRRITMHSMVNFYACSNLSATDEFYQSLGLTLFHSSPSCNIYDSGYGYLGFLEKENMILPDYSCISFNCKGIAEVDEIYSRLKNNYNCTFPAEHEKFSVYSFFLNDPDGYRVEFQYILNPALSVK